MTINVPTPPLKEGMIRCFDVPARARTRVYNQYRTRPKASAWYNIIPTLAQDFADTFCTMARSYDVDFAYGEMLDIIGDIVGVDRSIIVQVVFETYECGDESVECSNDVAQCSVPTASEESGLSDAYFRILIKAKVAKNTSDATIDSIINATNLILSAPVVRLYDAENMSFFIELYGGITDIELEMIRKDIIPRPQGVLFNGLLLGDEMTESGNSELMCGDSEAQCIGYISFEEGEFESWL